MGYKQEMEWKVCGRDSVWMFDFCGNGRYLNRYIPCRWLGLGNQTGMNGEVQDGWRLIMGRIEPWETPHFKVIRERK